MELEKNTNKTQRHPLSGWSKKWRYFKDMEIFKAIDDSTSVPMLLFILFDIYI